MTIKPEGQSAGLGYISSGADSKKKFYVVLTNVSAEAQPLFEISNSWGYQTISFEISLPDSKTVKVEMANQGFTVNFPGTYLIPPTESRVFPIILNKEWTGLPHFKEAGQTKINLKAIYGIEPTPESKKFGVWTGRIDSEEVPLVLNHW